VTQTQKPVSIIKSTSKIDSAGGKDQKEKLGNQISDDAVFEGTHLESIDGDDGASSAEESLGSSNDEESSVEEGTDAVVGPKEAPKTPPRDKTTAKGATSKDKTA
jgi:hypothetical protein